MKIKIPLILCLLLQSSLAFSQTYYVRNGGSDSATGLSDELAWATLAKVNGRTFSAGDNIYFKRGSTWNERLLIPSSGNSTGGYITFGAYGTGNKPVFDGTDLTTTYLPDSHGLIRGNSRSYIIIDNIRVQNVGIGLNFHNPGIGFYAGSNIIVQNSETYNTESAGIKFNSSSNVKVLYNDVERSNCNDISEQISIGVVNTFEVAYNISHDSCGTSGGGAGIDSKQGSTNGSVHHNEVYNIVSANGIYVDAYNATVTNIDVYNNYVHNIARGGIQIGAEEGGALSDVSIHHNIVTHAAWGGYVMHNTGPTGNAVSDIRVYNNTFYLNGTSGSADYGGVRIRDQLITTGGVILKNNIMASAYNFQAGRESQVAATDIIMANNVVYGVQADSGTFIAVSGSPVITGSPNFTNAATGDFTLAAGSSAIHACDNTVWAETANVVDYAGTPITDASGNILPAVGTVSCGALELVEVDVPGEWLLHGELH